jgi:hypothetical protein
MNRLERSSGSEKTKEMENDEIDLNKSRGFLISLDLVKTDGERKRKSKESMGGPSTAVPGKRKRACSGARCGGWRVEGHRRNQRKTMGP